ncbi:MAG: amino acid ABC transporter permease [Spirochaetaceae bacterium]|jgi:polar amino acid transport system permease protein|nr:amino acid ABC transporter permease [Spirochaetaceae bacterium]
MFSLCEGNVSYSSLPLFRKRWFATSLFLGELWLLLLLYYLPFGILSKFLARPLVPVLSLLLFWGCFLAVFFTGDVYALRKNSVYTIRLKFLFAALHFLVLILVTALAAGVVLAVPRYVPDGVKALFNRTAAWMTQLIDGSRVTLWLTVLAVSAGLVMSLFLALGKLSKRFWINRLCSAYVFFFRGTPLLMQLYFIYYGLPQITRLLTINNRFLAAFIAFSLNSAAYCAEIIRAAILSIDKGQFEASRALGLSYGQTMSLVIVPQSIRRLIPPVGNEFIMMLKDASLVSLIALTDITKVTRSISSSTASAMVYIPAMILYLIITAVFTFVFHKLENKYSIYV